MTSGQLVEYAVIGFFIAYCGVAVVAWGFSAFYMIKTLNRFHPDRTWGKYVGYSLFVPWFFTEEGNRYRVKLLKSAGFFVALVGIALIFGAATGTLTTGPGSNKATGGLSSNSTPHADAREPHHSSNASGARAGERER
jgi:hypothetical protein